MNPSRPNILLVCTDQMRSDTPGCNGNQVCRTPNIDTLANQGTVFERAYSPSSVCAPSRASMYTGRFAFHHGMVNNCDLYQPAIEDLPDSEPLLTSKLKQSGYQLGHVGKWHIGKHRGPAFYGFDGMDMPGYGSIIDNPEFRWYLEQRELTYTVGNPIYFNPDKQGLLAGTWDGPVESTPAHYLTDRTIELLHEYNASEQPFFLACHYYGPHQPYLPSREFAGTHDPKQIPEWVNFRDDWSGKPAMVRRMHTSFYRSLPEDWTGWSAVVARYYDFVSMIDHEIGRLLTAVNELNLTDNTIVIFTSDHGDMTGAHGGMNDKGFMYEEAHRIPLIVRWPGKIAAGARRDEMVHNMDILPTVCRFLELDPGNIDGRPLPLAGLANQQPRTELLLENHGIRFLYSQRSLVTNDGWKYIFTPGDDDECYNLQTDPGELINLLADTSKRDSSTNNQIEHLRDRFIETVAGAHDPLATAVARFFGQWSNFGGQPDVSGVLVGS